MSHRPVTLLTDFGTSDGYTAAMMGVIAAAAPEAALHHAAHDIPHGDIEAAALALSRYAFLYPEGTVHLIVVDPGVGTERRAIAAEIRGRYFVAPDNGVLTRVLADAVEARVVSLDTGSASSATFHGRDLFAPAAGRLARGEALKELGAAIPDPATLPIAEAHRSAGRLGGEVIQVDRYGNLISNIPAHWLHGHGVGDPEDEAGGAAVEEWTVRVAEREVGQVLNTYGDVETGALVALIGSLDTVEVSVRDGSAAERLGVGRGAPVVLEARPKAVLEARPRR